MRLLLESSYRVIEIIVVDNGSLGGLVEFIRSANQDLVFSDSDKNLGYAGGMNLRIR